jgi:hypothetical protein
MTGMELDHLRRDLRAALRTLARERAFAACAVLLIALSAGASAAMFALVDGASLRKRAVPDPDALVNIAAVHEAGLRAVPYSVFERLREHLDGAAGVFGSSTSFVPTTYD